MSHPAQPVPPGPRSGTGPVKLSAPLGPGSRDDRGRVPRAFGELGCYLDQAKMEQITRYFGSIVPRRRVLRDLGTAAVGCVAAATLGSSGCSNQDDQQADTLSVSLDELPEGQRVVVRLRDRPVELMRQGDRVVARSLVCTHIGCVVRWNPAENLYVCPCHRGRFDENGRVVDGPPTRPLAEISTRVSGTHVVLGG